MAGHPAEEISNLAEPVQNVLCSQADAALAEADRTLHAELLDWRGLTARQLIEQHSSAPGCATCHVKIDHFGFALEQYDAIGRVRPLAVDTKTQAENGTQIEGLAGLKDYLLSQRRDEIVRQFCRKLLGFALGREVQLSDEPLLDIMEQRLADNDYRFSVAVETIVTSDQFRKIRARDE